MVARYIDADALKMQIVEKGQGSTRYRIGEIWELNRDEIWQTIDEVSTADVRENVRGEWIYEGNGVFRCSFCGERYYLVDDAKLCDYNFCPNCGADMRGEK